MKEMIYKKTFVWSFITIKGSRLFAFFHSLGIQHATNNVISYSNQVLYPSTAKHDHRVFLQVMSFAGNISGHFHAISQANSGDLTQSRVWLFRSSGGNLGTDSPLERRRKKHRPVFQNIKSTSQGHCLVLGVNFHSFSFN